MRISYICFWDTFYRAAVPHLFGSRDRFCGRQFFHRLEAGDGFGIIQAYYIYCALYFYYYYIVIYNEIIILLTIMQNQWEPWACFPATRWSHLEVIQDSETWSVLLMSSLLCKMQLNCHLPLTDRVLIWICKQLIYYGLCANLSANDNLYLQPLPSASITASAPPQIIRH